MMVLQCIFQPEHQEVNTVAIGRALQPFPRSKRSVRLSTHSAFQFGQWQQRGRVRSCLRRGAPVSRTIICLPLCIRLLSFPSTSPGGPSPCPRYYRVAFGYYAASALRPARWHFRVLLKQVKQCRSSPIPSEDTSRVTRSCLLSAGWTPR
jgi:hypothetical protein